MIFQRLLAILEKYPDEHFHWKFETAINWIWNLEILSFPMMYDSHSLSQWYHLVNFWSLHHGLICHSTKRPVTTMLTYPWKCTVLHCNHLGNTWKPLVLMTRHFDYCPSRSEGDNQSVGSSAPVVSRCFPGGYNVKLYISRGRLAWWLLAFLHSVQLQWQDCRIPVCFCKWIGKSRVAGDLQ